MKSGTCLAALFGLAAAAPGWAAPAHGPASLLSNPDFSVAQKGNQWPDGWPQGKGISWETENGQHFLRLKVDTPGQTVLAYRQLTLPTPPPAALEIQVRARYSDIQPGKESWYEGRLILHIKNQAGASYPDPAPLAFHGSSDGWVDQTEFIKVPIHAHLLEVMPALFQVKAGTLDLARLAILPARADQLPKLPPIIPSTTLVPDADAVLPPALHVAGNRLCTADGKEVWLQGLCVDSLEWSAGGEHIQQSIPEAIDVWKANVIRLPVKESFWFGRSPWQHDGGLGYRKLVDWVVNAIASRHAYVSLDLHDFGAPTAEQAEFWKDAATRYKNNPAVLFELFNEPHDTSWKVWRDGGDLTDPKNPASTNLSIQMNDEPSVGMQGLLDTVRATGANNVVIAGGLDWGYDLSGVLKGYALKDHSGGSGIMYSSHVYPWKSGWQANTLDAAAKYPIFVGEVGCSTKPMPFQKTTEDPNTWAPDVLGMIQKYHLNWTGFSFHPTCGPNAISDWNYTPTPYWGVFVKDALSGKAFTLKKLR